MQKYLEFLQEYCSFLTDTVAQQENQLAALLEQDVKVMEQAAGRQQAIAMQMKNMEENRLKYQEQAGFAKELTLQQVAQQCEGEQRQKLLQMQHQFQEAVSQIRFLNQKIAEVAQTSLKVIELALTPEKHADTQRYTASGSMSEDAGSGSVFETKI